MSLMFQSGSYILGQSKLRRQLGYLWRFPKSQILRMVWWILYCCIDVAAMFDQEKLESKNIKLSATHSVVYSGARWLLAKGITNMKQLFTHKLVLSWTKNNFTFDWNTEAPTKSKIILKLRNNSRMGIYCSFLFIVH